MCGANLLLTQGRLGQRLTDADTRGLCCRYSPVLLSARVGSGSGVNFGGEPLASLPWDVGDWSIPGIR